MSKLITRKEQNTIGVGTQKFMAPEIIYEVDNNEKVDVYSFGVLIKAEIQSKFKSYGK